MTTFLQELQRGTNLTTTENGAVTNKSSMDALVDYFAMAGAMRGNLDAANGLFERAYRADKQTAVRTLFYLRDIRGGQGERELFRAGLEHLVGLREHWTLSKILKHVPFYGRWDDLSFLDYQPGVVGDMIAQTIAQQLTNDRGDYLSSPSAQVSLLAKWLPSENASSKETIAQARRLRTSLDLSSAEYRRMLSALRKRIHLLEQDMSSNKWSGIDYEAVPSQAHRKHVKAFYRHDQDRYAAYLESVEKGEAKINASTLYPYEVYDMVKRGEHATANALWGALPDYTGGDDALVMADVSGSMYGLPMSVSVSLALYFAERNTGAFKGHFMTFSGNPQLVKVQGNNLAQRMAAIETADWGQNTDLSKAFRTIRDAASRSMAPPPKVLYIISDMEFDQATTTRTRYVQPQNDTVFETARYEFAEHGLKLPHVVFWNVNARQQQAPATILDGQVSLVSGCSPSIFAQAVEGKTPLELVESVVNGERYSRIVL